MAGIPKAGKTKVIKKSAPAFAAGGTTKMFGKQHAGTDRPGETSGTKAGAGGKWAKGGTTKMFGQQHAGPKIPGFTGKKPGFSKNPKAS